MINTLKRLNSDQLLRIAIAISLGLHLVLFMVIFFQPDNQQQSSLGNGQVILLEHLADKPTKISDHLSDTQAASQKNDQTETQGINGEQAEPIESTLDQTVQINSPDTETRHARNTSNQGNLLDQSGDNSTPQQRYRQRVTQHLLNKIKNSPYQGDAIIHLNIIKLGIATEVAIQLIDGPMQYKSWLKQKVLNANPLPTFPSDLKKASIKLAISIGHDTE